MAEERLEILFRCTVVIDGYESVCDDLCSVSKLMVEEKSVNLVLRMVTEKCTWKFIKFL
jgi:hypothetical protein